MMRVLSDIYPPEIKPVREGWYLTRDAHIYMPGENPWILREYRLGLWLFGRHGGRDYMCHWRGLAFDPAGAWEDRLGRAFIESQRIIEFDGVFVPGGDVR